MIGKIIFCQEKKEGKEKNPLEAIGAPLYICTTSTCRRVGTCEQQFNSTPSLLVNFHGI
jgi:hypothetical protein